MPHYYDEKNVPLNPYLINIHFNKQKYEFYSGSGIFSREKLDRGSEVLIQYARVSSGDKILDLGCGNGVIGILLKITKNVIPEFSDISNNAITCTKLNMKKYDVNTKITKSFVYEKLGVYDCIITNPPYVAGRDICSEIVNEGINHLKKGGSLQIVVKYNKGGKFFEGLMKEVFGNVETLAKKSGYRVFMSVK